MITSGFVRWINFEKKCIYTYALIESILVVICRYPSFILITEEFQSKNKYTKLKKIW